MTCRELLQSPVYCRVTDTPERALDIMNITELPSLPVVSDHQNRLFQGIVFAAALRAAAGHLPAQVGALVQPAGLVGHPDDDFARLSGEMTQRDLCAVPVVDAGNRLVGILTRDAAFTSASSHAPPPPADARGSAKGCVVAGAALAGVAAGASLVYLLDPNRGRARRAHLASRTTGLLHRAGHAVEQWQHHLANRATGLQARAHQLLQQEPVSDSKLLARVRAQLGRLVAHPHQVDVRVTNGNVALTGNMSADELARLESTVAGLAGVHAVAVAGPRL